MSEWALRKMSTTDFSMVPNLEGLKMQVRGPSRLAGLTYEEDTMAIQRAWSASTAGTRSHRSRPARLLVQVQMGQQRARHRRPQAVLSSPPRPQDQEAEAPETASRRLELVGG